MPTGNSVLILGCGVGGLVAANTLAKQAKRAASITVVERKTSFQFPPSYPWLMMGWRQPKQVQRNLARLSRKRIKVINENVKSIDIAKKRVRTDSSELAYDHLVLALGAEYAPEEVPGFGQHANHIYDLESTLKFRDALQSLPEGGTLAIGISRLPFKCPAAPYEAAFLLEDHFRKRGKKVNIQFFTPEAQPVPAAGRLRADVAAARRACRPAAGAVPGNREPGLHRLDRVQAAPRARDPGHRTRGRGDRRRPLRAAPSAR
ncbi:MAG: FAD/NAD(P)-binding oxidoreductase, partial [Thermoproteota archaeon]